MARLTADQLRKMSKTASPTTPGNSDTSASEPSAPQTPTESSPSASYSSPAGYQPYQPSADTGSSPLLGQQSSPTAAAIQQTKDDLFKTKHPVLNFLSQAFTGHTQKFAQTLGSAMSTGVSAESKSSGLLGTAEAIGAKAIGLGGQSATDQINEAHIAESEARLRLAQALKTASPEQAVRIRRLLAEGSDVGTATELDPTLLKTNRQVYGEGLGTAMEALSGGQLAGTSGPAKSLGGAVLAGGLRGAAYGTVSGVATAAEENKSAAEIGLSGVVGGATGGVIGGGLGAASYGVGKLFQQHAEEKARDLVGKAVKETGPNLDKAMEAVETFDADDLSKINNDYGKLHDVAQARVSALDDELTKKLPTDKLPLNSFDDIVTGGNGKVLAKNPIEDSLTMLNDLYEAKGDLRAQASIQKLQEKAATEGISGKEINDLARQFGAEYSGFNPKTGIPLTSHRAEAYELTRAALKDAARSTITDDAERKAAQAIDAKMSNMLLLRDSAGQMVDEVQKVENTMNQRGFLAQTAHVAGKVVNYGNMAKSFLSELFPAMRGPDTINAIEAQAQLSQNLELANKLLNMSDDELKKFLVKQATARATSQAINKSVPVVSQIAGKEAVKLLQ